jgi:hypothetical protein
MNPQNSKEHRTADLALTAALCVHGFAIEKVERVTPTRSVFIFSKSDQLEEIIERYWRRELTVEPQEYFDQLKVLKARIYEL